MAVTTAESIAGARGRRTAYARLMRVVAALFRQWAEASLISDPIAYSYWRSGQQGSAASTGRGDGGKA